MNTLNWRMSGGSCGVSRGMGIIELGSEWSGVGGGRVEVCGG